MKCGGRRIVQAPAARFRDLVGLPPGQYLTRLRMSRAEDALARTDATVAKVAADVG